MATTPDDRAAFVQEVWDFYATNRRRMPWRDNPSPYFVMVAELMLQQTQVGRVTPKFIEFVARFPSVQVLAESPLGDVLQAWNGLGYNRRAKFLWLTAGQIVGRYGGQLPNSYDDLITLPGIGPNTAGAILAYAFNQPVVFIETNIRSLFIYYFFTDQTTVTDASIRKLVEATVPAKNPREWYWALMDYGTYIKANVGAQLHKVHGYRPQSRFEGSRRQVRGKVIRLLAEGPHTTNELAALIIDDRLQTVIQDLQQEGFLVQSSTGWQLAR